MTDPVSDDYDEQAEDAWYEEKSAFLQSVLGREHDYVMHAIIPYEVGGGLDLYYYPNGIPGTGVATKELAGSNGGGPGNDLYPAYELVMFTREKIDLDQALDDVTPFGAVHATIDAILNSIARYSEQATLNPLETCEFPQGFERIGGKCLIFDAYSDAESDRLGLMLIMEVFRDEMEYAHEHGGAALIDLLKAKRVYPYSDLNRAPVTGLHS